MTAATTKVGGFLQLGYLFGGPHDRDCSILESMLGRAFLGELPSPLCRNCASVRGVKVLPVLFFFWCPDLEGTQGSRILGVQQLPVVTMYGPLQGS